MILIKESELKKYMLLVASNFRFKLDENFDLIFKLIFQQVQNLDKSEIEHSGTVTIVDDIPKAQNE